MMIFDASERNVCIAQRQSTSTPLQALVLMNDPQYVEASRVLAERMVREGGPSDEERIAFAFRALVSRDPQQEELDALISLLASQRAHFRSAQADARRLLTTGEYARDTTLPAAEIASLTTVASTIMNHDATLYLR